MRICFKSDFAAVSVIMIMSIFLEMMRIKDDILFETLIFRYETFFFIFIESINDN